MSQATQIPEEMRIFLVECYELLDSVEQDLLALEDNPTNIDILNNVFRSVHTIKGNSGFLGLSSLESVCHKGEAVLDRLRSNKMSCTPEIITTLLQLLDSLRALLGQVEHTGKDAGVDITAQVAALANLIQ